MSKGLENFLPQTEPVSPDYPWGDIKDNTGVGDGTNVDRYNHADYHQTFRKLLDLAGLTPNNLPDNVTNGYQYISAMDKYLRNFFGVKNYPTNATITLTYQEINCLINVEGNTSTKNFNLPLGSNCKQNDTITFFNNSNQLVIIGSGTEFVNGGADITLIQAGDYVQLVLDKANSNWVCSYLKSTPLPFVLNPITVGSGGTAPVFQNGFTFFTGYPVRFVLDSLGYISIVGTARHVGSLTGEVIFTLPPGYRPQVDKQFIVYADDSGTVKNIAIVVRSNGDVEIGVGQIVGSGTLLCVLDNIRFLNIW